MFFAEAQLGLMYQQETVHRALPLFGARRGATPTGWPAAVASASACSRTIGEWLIEPSVGFGGFHLHLGSVAETGGALAENIGGATLGSAESTLAVSAQRAFALNETVRDDCQELAWVGRTSSPTTRRVFRRTSPAFAAAALR